MDELGGISAAGILVVLVLREVLGFLRSQNKSGPSVESASSAPYGQVNELEEQMRMTQQSMARMSASCEKMAEVMSVKDADGLPLVYTPRSLGKNIDALTLSISKLSEHVQYN